MGFWLTLSMRAFSDYINSNSLIDLGLDGAFYTFQLTKLMIRPTLHHLHHFEGECISGSSSEVHMTQADDPDSHWCVI